MTDPEREQLEMLGNRMVDKMIEVCTNERAKKVLSDCRWLYVQGYVAGAQDVLKTVQDGATEIRTGFLQGQLQAKIAAKLGLG